MSIEEAGTVPLAASISDTEDYVNPLENSPRWQLAAKAYAIRSGASIGFGILNMSSPSPTKTIWLNSTLGNYKGKEKIKVDIWQPPRPQVTLRRNASSTTIARLSRNSSSSTLSKLTRTISASSSSSKLGKNGPTLAVPDLNRIPSSSSTAPKKRTAIINFHGGGFILGQGSDDALWAAAVQKAIPDAIILSVNYRLAPEFPFPVGVEDCADAILQIARRSEEFDIDADLIFLSGFSAGATLSLASWVLLTQPQRWNYHLPGVAPQIAGMALFYPSLDWTVTRPRKRLSCARPDQTLPKGMTDLFDASYVYPPIPRGERDDARLSPGLMPDELLDRLPPIHMCLCQNDMLLAEGQRFVERLKTAGMEVGVRVVENEKHGWDRMPTLFVKESVGVEYGFAIEAVRSWVGQKRGAQDSER